MDAIILFSHGSVLCGAARPLAEHAARLRDAGCAPIVEIGFLNYTAPSFAQAVDRCVVAGASRIGVVPFFLVPGRFVSADLPRCVEAAHRVHPRLAFEIAEPLGYSSALAEAVHDLAAGAHPIAEARDLLPRDPVSCEGDPACPLYDTVDCPRHPGAAAFPNTTTPEIANTGSADALLLLAHGSPRETANEPILRVAAAVRRRGTYRVVQVGFLDCNRPTIPEAIDACAAQGRGERSRGTVFPPHRHARGPGSPRVADRRRATARVPADTARPAHRRLAAGHGRTCAKGG